MHYYRKTTTLPLLPLLPALLHFTLIRRVNRYYIHEVSLMSVLMKYTRLTFFEYDYTVSRAAENGYISMLRLLMDYASDYRTPSVLVCSKTVTQEVRDIMSVAGYPLCKC